MKERILTCPECGSRNLFYEAAMMMGQMYHCRDCDYIGAFVVEREVEFDED